MLRPHRAGGGGHPQHCAGIADKGGRVVREPGPMKHGTTVIAFVEDPDGYKVELIEMSSKAHA